jgi:uncharacterized delta-60 repeat protein
VTRPLALALATLALLPAAASAAAGDPDPSFDGDGKRTVPHPYIANEVLAQPDGKILVVGNGGPEGDFVVTRLLSDGSYDRSFDGDGTAYVDFGGKDQANAAALQPDGSIVIAGESEPQGSGSLLAVARLLPTGKPDPAFGAGGDGKTVVNAQGAPYDAAAVLVRPDGRIVIAGAGYSDTYDMAVVQLTSGGEPDGTEWDRGNFGEQASPRGAALAADGTLVVAGTRSPELAPGEIALARFRPDGKLDTAFGGTGKVTLPTGEQEDVAAVVVQDDGKVVVAGTTGRTFTQMIATRFDREGELDRSWGDGGRASADFDGYSMGAAATLQPDGKVVVAGVWIGEIDVAAARFTTSGTLDPTFSADGRASIAGGFIEVAQAVALQPDGKVVLAGAGTAGALVARLLADPPPAPPPPPAAGDTLPPALSGLRVTPKRIRFTLSEPARVRFTVQRLRGGRARRVVRSFAVDARAGLSRVPLRARRLRAGRYRLTAVPVDRAGNSGRAKRAPFRLANPSTRRTT